jgi:hypothetical protein
MTGKNQMLTDTSATLCLIIWAASKVLLREFAIARQEQRAADGGVYPGATREGCHPNMSSQLISEVLDA